MAKKRKGKMNPLLEGAIVGFFSGLAVAAGGAIKDAPYEGFDFLKFFRSPVIGTVERAISKNISPNLNDAWLFLAVIGEERITTETYKLIRAHKPSKFTYGEWGVPK